MKKGYRPIDNMTSEGLTPPNCKSSVIEESKKIKIGYKEYEIVKKLEVINLPNECYGKIDYDKETIEISNKYSQKQQNATFLHELIHAIFEKLDLDDLRTNEQIVNQVSSTLYEIILDNPHIFTMKDV